MALVPIETCAKVGNKNKEPLEFFLLQKHCKSHMAPHQRPLHQSLAYNHQSLYLQFMPVHTMPTAKQEKKPTRCLVFLYDHRQGHAARPQLYLQ